MTEKPIPDRNVKEMNEADKIAKFYGFQPIIPPTVEKKDADSAKSFDLFLHPAEKVALLRMYFDEKMFSQPQPNLFYCQRPFASGKGLPAGRREKKSFRRLEGSLISLGSFKSVCECLSIEAGLSILNAVGYKNLEVEINSIGDKDSAAEFQRKFVLFVKKNFNSFPPELKQAARKNPFTLLKECRHEWQNLQIECPKSLDFLSEQSRAHFKEVLEFLEAMEIPYEINQHLIGDLDIGSETVFSIKNEGEELAYGFRFNRLAKKIGYKKDLPCTILNISAKLKKNLRKTKIKPIKPQFYLVQFGPEAKLKSFVLLKELYKAGAKVVHSIAKDKLGSQMGAAENSGIPYILLMGQKEALENSVVIRNSATRAQEIVSLSEFGEKIKRLI